MQAAVLVQPRSAAGLQVVSGAAAAVREAAAAAAVLQVRGVAAGWRWRPVATQLALGCDLHSAQRGCRTPGQPQPSDRPTTPLYCTLYTPHLHSTYPLH